MLIILAGVSINLVVGDNGIITKAKLSKQLYQNAQEQEISSLESLAASMTAGKIAKVENGVQYIGDGIGNIIPVPVGFSYLEGNKDNGFVIKNDDDNNEFVWIPVTNMKYTYDRYAFATENLASSQSKGIYDEVSKSYKIIRQDFEYSYFIEKMPAIGEKTELDSVNKFGGYYIARYEVGISGYTNLNTINSNNDENWTGYTSGTPIIQKGKQVWNYITRNKAKEIAESMYASNTNITSSLCSSYAWDTALKFIETNYPDYPVNSIQGNYRNSAFNYIDLDGNSQVKESNNPVLVPTGQTISVKNIYDMGGNINEWTTEVFGYENYPATLRGCQCFDSSSDIFPASSRNFVPSTTCDGLVGFRITLFL